MVPYIFFIVCLRFLLLDEVVAFRAVFVIVFWLDGQAETLLEPANSTRPPYGGARRNAALFENVGDILNSRNLKMPLTLN